MLLWLENEGGVRRIKLRASFVLRLKGQNCTKEASFLVNRKSAHGELFETRFKMSGDTKGMDDAMRRREEIQILASSSKFLINHPSQNQIASSTQTLLNINHAAAFKQSVWPCYSMTTNLKSLSSEQSVLTRKTSLSFIPPGREKSHSSSQNTLVTEHLWSS